MTKITTATEANEKEAYEILNADISKMDLQQLRKRAETLEVLKGRVQWPIGLFTDLHNALYKCKDRICDLRATYGN